MDRPQWWPFQSLSDEADEPPEGSIRSRLAGQYAELTQVARLYGLLRGYFRSKPERGERLQQHLNEARMGVRYDAYLARAVTIATIIGVTVGVLAGVGTTLSLVGETSIGRLLVSVLGVGVGMGGVVVAGGWWVALYYPRWRARKRRTRIDLLLPQSISYLYALSAGGSDITEVIRALAEEDETYGEVAAEFDYIVREMDYFGSDPLTAIGKARDLTPSENLETFLDDLVSTIESGGNSSTFLRSESEKYFQQAQESQESFIDELATVAELYVGIGVVGPLMLIIVLLLINVVGGELLLPLYATVYLVVPLLLGLVVLIVDDISSSYQEIDIEPAERAIESPPPATIDDDRLEQYRDRRRRVAVEAILSRPAAYISERPIRVLTVSVPAALLTVGGLVAVGFVTPSVETIIDAPVGTTGILLVLPFVIAVTPLAVLHEQRARWERSVISRFPDVLNQLSTANEMGLSVADGMDLVARRTEGPLASELRLTANDSYWGGDFGDAIGRLAERIGNPQAARTLRLVQTANRVSGNIHQVLDVAARDATNADRMRRHRQGEMRPYTIVVVITFIIYLAIILTLDMTYLSVFAEITEELPETADLPVQFGDVDSGVYRTVLFHSALIQAVGSGLIAGKMGEDSLLSGLKYSIALVVLTIIAYGLVIGA